MPGQFTILIIDDELQSRALIRKMLLDIDQHTHILEADSAATALEMINEHAPHLLFLDIQMNGETGFDLLDKLSHISFEIIFTTAHSGYAVRAFRYSAMDYLMKPIDPHEFTESYHKACERIKKKSSVINQQVQFLQQVRDSNNLPDKLAIPTAEGLHFISISNILYCHAINNYTEFYLSDKQKIISSHTLGYYDEWLASRLFFRVHRSYLINLSHVKLYKRGDGGTVTMNDGREIEVSRNNKEAFLKLFRG